MCTQSPDIIKVNQDQGTACPRGLVHLCIASRYIGIHQNLLAIEEGAKIRAQFEYIHHKTDILISPRRVIKYR